MWGRGSRNTDDTNVPRRVSFFIFQHILHSRHHLHIGCYIRFRPFSPLEPMHGLKSKHQSTIAFGFTKDCLSYPPASSWTKYARWSLR